MVVIGTRASLLAVSQANIVARNLKKKDQALRPVIRKIVEEGDLKGKTSLSMTGKDLFTRRIDTALKRREVDLAVHSLKDVPVDNRNYGRIEIIAYPKREDASDVLVSKKGYNIKSLPRGARIGTSSVRRAIQLRTARPDITIVELHGNVVTRLKRLDSSELDALVLAKAGLVRLGYNKLGTKIPSKIMLPAPGQGCLAVSVRAGDSRNKRLASILDDKETRLTVTAERAFSKYLGGGCNTPLAAHAEIRGNKIHLEGLIQRAGSNGLVIRASKIGSMKDPVSLGRSLAAQLKSAAKWK